MSKTEPNKKMVRANKKSSEFIIVFLFWFYECWVLNSNCQRSCCVFWQNHTLCDSISFQTVQSNCVSFNIQDAISWHTPFRHNFMCSFSFTSMQSNVNENVWCLRQSHTQSGAHFSFLRIFKIVLHFVVPNKCLGTERHKLR